MHQKVDLKNNKESQLLVYCLPQLQFSWPQPQEPFPDDPQPHEEDSLQLSSQQLSQPHATTDFSLLKVILSASMYPFMNARSSFSSIDFRNSSLFLNISISRSWKFSFSSFIFTPRISCSSGLYTLVRKFCKWVQCLHWLGMSAIAGIRTRALALARLCPTRLDYNRLRDNIASN